METQQNQTNAQARLFHLNCQDKCGADVNVNAVSTSHSASSHAQFHSPIPCVNRTRSYHRIPPITPSSKFDRIVNPVILECCQFCVDPQHTFQTHLQIYSRSPEHRAATARHCTLATKTAAKHESSKAAFGLKEVGHFIRFEFDSAQ